MKGFVHRAIDPTKSEASPAIRPLRRGRPITAGARVVLSALSRPTVLALALFHGWLFWNRLADGRLLEPAVAFRWVAGALILAGFLGLRRLPRSGRTARSGIPGSAGRSSLILWLFVILLHCQVIGASSGVGFEPAVLPETVLVLGSNLALVTAGTVLGLALLAGSRRGETARLLASRGVAAGATAPAALAAGFLTQLSPRPPPA